MRCCRMRSVPTTLLDLSASEVVTDPYPWFAAERARHSVAWHDGLGMFVTFSHSAAQAVLRDRRLGRIWRDRLAPDSQPVDYLEPFNLLHRNQMMENEPPDHARLRRPVATAFNRGHVERLRPRVRTLAATLLDEAGVADAGSNDAGGAAFDVIGGYAEPLPVLVICELLGVPASYVGSLRVWSQAIVKMYEPSPSAAVTSAAVSAAGEFAGVVRELAAARRHSPADDLISDLVATSLSDDEVVASVVLLLNAGHEASVNVFGNGLVALLSRGLAPAADIALTVEEMLRFDSTLQLFERTAVADVEVAGIPVPTGAKVAALLGAANRDPAVFPDPDAFVVDRDPNSHLAFGAGLHFCLGAPLARMELAESLALLLARRPGLHVAEPPVARGTFVLRGYREVIVA
jgi:cytochrome P450